MLFTQTNLYMVCEIGIINYTTMGFLSNNYGKMTGESMLWSSHYDTDLPVQYIQPRDSSILDKI